MTYVPAATIGQGAVLQSSKRLEAPVQFFPPFWGYGSEQVLEREYFPPPHDTEHGPYVPHADQPPSTGIKYNQVFLLRFI